MRITKVNVERTMWNSAHNIKRTK